MVCLSEWFPWSWAILCCPQPHQHSQPNDTWTSHKRIHSACHVFPPRSRLLLGNSSSGSQAKVFPWSLAQPELISWRCWELNLRPSVCKIATKLRPLPQMKAPYYVLGCCPSRFVLFALIGNRLPQKLSPKHLFAGIEAATSRSGSVILPH